MSKRMLFLIHIIFELIIKSSIKLVKIKRIRSAIPIQSPHFNMIGMPYMDLKRFYIQML